MRSAPWRWLTAAALVVTALPAPAQTPSPSASAPPVTASSPPVGNAATVNGQPVPEVSLQRVLERVPAKRRADARPELLNFLIDNLLVEQYLLQLQIPVDKAAVDKKVEEMRAEAKKAGEDFNKVLEKLRMSEAELREHLTADLRWDAFLAKHADEKKLHEVFDGSKELFDGSNCRARHILLTPPADDARAGAEAEARLKRIKQEIEGKVAAGVAKVPGAADTAAREKARTAALVDAFAEAAKKESACPSKEQGGDVGWFQRTGVMVDGFAKAAFAVKPNEMTDVVKTQFGYHLILVTDRRPGREPKFEEVKEEVREVWADRMREAIVAQMRQRAKIVVAPAPK